MFVWELVRGHELRNDDSQSLTHAAMVTDPGRPGHILTTI